MASDHPSRILKRSIAALAATALMASVSRAEAQTDRIAVDVVGSTDSFVGSTVPRYVGVWADVFGAVRVAEGLDIVARPVFFRRTFNGEWSSQIYQLGIQYERPGDPGSGWRSVGLRVDAGQMPMPIGIGMLENRPDLNPVVSQHSAYYLPQPRVDPELPRTLRTFLIAGSYPFGAQLTLATGKWDARVAAIDASPVRGRNMIGSNTPRMANWVAGFGVTPHIGLRVGAAFAYGAYAKAEEVVDPSLGDRIATMAQAEGEWSFGHTRIAGELIRSTFESTRAEDAVSHGGWIEVTQTVHPRIFIAGRADVQEVDYSLLNGTRSTEPYHRYEAVGGFRITPDLTARAGYMTRYGYVVTHWDDQFVISLTWQRKIF
jgi:hypothetical protein